MKELDVKLTVSSLLHDIGKVIYRKGDDKRNHSLVGYSYLKENNLLEDKDILDGIRFHHYKDLSSADIENDALAYIVYIADNISAAADRREKDDGESTFYIHTPLQPVFNILNGNNSEMYYEPELLNFEEEINYPIDQKKEFAEDLYSKIIANISDNLNGISWSDEYINSLLEVLEANLSYVPSSTSQKELCDVSLYDHLKLTAAIASCINNYMGENQIHDYKVCLFDKADEFYDKEAFALASIDISGIQSFIYTITTSNALKTLRARSFYLEILMEHVIDMILDRINLSRANLLYSGGGHCYMLIPNTDVAKSAFDEVVSEVNEWLIERFDISLYMAADYVPCSGNDLKNQPSGVYTELVKQLSQKLSRRKANRYSVEQIKALNNKKQIDYERECVVCKRTGIVNANGRCPFCDSIEKLSKNVLYSDFYLVSKDEREGLSLPGDYILTSESESSLKEKLILDEENQRLYSKNKLYMGKHLATKLWVGDYTTGDSFEEYAKAATGIKRIGVLRADVDNLGQAIVSGLYSEKNKDKYQTISRTSTFSRQLSLFFKLYINKILSKANDFKYGEDKRRCSIVYSGGDDVFIVGAWNDVLGVAIDLRHALNRYTEGTLSISAGVGFYEDSYPISVIASEVARAEDRSKDNRDDENNIIKNSITVFENQTYTWEEFETKVIGEKLKCLESFFGISDSSGGEYGKNFLYNLYELIRNQNEKINYARYVYLISRMEPDSKKNPELIDEYQVFSSNMLKWIQNEQDISQLETAILLYVYLTRDKEVNGDNDN